MQNIYLTPEYIHEKVLILKKKEKELKKHKEAFIQYMRDNPDDIEYAMKTYKDLTNTFKDFINENL